MRTIPEVIHEISEAEKAWHVESLAQLPTQYLFEWARDLQEAYDALVAEALDVVNNLASESQCMHCDMQSACQEGEDGMPTACTPFIKARHFREKYRVEEKNDNDDTPF